MSPQAEFTEEKIQDDESVASDIDKAWEQHGQESDDGGEEAPDPSLRTEPEAKQGTSPDGREDSEPKILSEESMDAKEIATDKPPAGMSAAAREEWKTAAPALKADIVKRERDYSIGLQKNAEWAQRAQQMDQALAPYQQYMAINGGAGAVVDLLQAASVLQMGSPDQQAQEIANIIGRYNIDIEKIDSVLSGQQVTSQQQPQLSEREYRIEAFLANQEQMQYQETQRQQYIVNQSVGDFMANPSNEFADLVREDMADLLQGAANRGISMSLDQAYTKACRMRDDIFPIVNSRTNGQDLQKRRNAASSITGAPGGSTIQSDSDDVRGALEKAWDGAGQI